MRITTFNEKNVVRGGKYEEVSGLVLLEIHPHKTKLEVKTDNLY